MLSALGRRVLVYVAAGKRETATQVGHSGTWEVRDDPLKGVKRAMGEVVAVCTSKHKGIPKENVERGLLLANHGLEGDAHAGPWHRQVSLLALESIAKMRAAGLEVGPGDFAENLTTNGLDLVSLPLGTRLAIGPQAVGEVSQIGKDCHRKCAVYYRAGDCVMPREGIFIKVLEGGPVAVGDRVEVLSSEA